MIIACGFELWHRAGDGGEEGFGGVLVEDDGDVWVELEDGGGDLWGDFVEEGLFDDFGFAGGIGEEEDFFSLHDCFDTHGEGVFWDVVGGGEEAGVGGDCGLGEGSVGGVFREMVGGLVEADVAVCADAEDLEVDAAGLFDFGFVLRALEIGVECGAVRDVDLVGGDVDGVEEIFVHIMVVALVASGVERVVFVEVKGGDLAEVDFAGFVAFDDFGVGAEWGATGGESEDASWLSCEFGAEDVGGLYSHFVVGIGDEDFDIA